MSLHRRITPVAVGSSGAEGLAATCLTSSLEHSTLNAPMLNLASSVQPVLHSFFTWSPEVLRLARIPGRRIFRQPSDAPMLRHRFNRCPCFLPNSSNASQRSIGSFKFILSLDFYYALTSLRRIGLVILMVDWTWRLDDRLGIVSWRWIRHVDSYPWDLKTPTSVISQTC